MTELHPGDHLTAELIGLVAHVAAPLGDRAVELRDQAAEAIVDAYSATMIDVVMPNLVAALDMNDGPIPSRAIVFDGDRPIGEILVWVRSGRLIGLEQAWFTDEPPTSWPSPEVVKVA
jgi:hypothetical protein